MPFNNIINRTKVAPLIPEDVAREVWTKATDESAALTMFRKVPVAQTQQRIPVLAALPTAYFLSTTDTGLKQTTEMSWSNKYLNVEELAAIIPIPEAVLDDTQYDIWGEVQPLLVEALGRAIDAAVFFGTGKPSSWPTDIQTAATAAGNSQNEGATAANGGFQDDLDQLYAKVEADGYDVNGIVASRSTKSKLRRARDTTGQRLGEISPDLTSYLGERIIYPMRGLFPSGGGTNTNVRLFAGDWTQFVLGIRQDVTWKMLDQAVIQDNTGAIQYNLAQQDMVAMRVVFRLGWQVANIINFEQPTEANRYPVGVLMY